GLPLAANGEESDMSRAVREFVDQLQHHHPAVQFHFQDERFSSRQADARFKAARQDGRARRRDAANLDSHAAAVILESWLAEQALAS
ncbi:MAG: Holliday junction resolvase RuvX, partial [Pseudomonadota bacterium]